MSQSIEVVIPVHDPARPLERGLRSVLDQRAQLAALGVELTATVVCHNIAVKNIQATLPPALATDDAVSWLECEDGIRSPAGPRNTALAHSTATFLCFLDSDDYLELGSLEAWWKVAETHTAAAVIAPLRTPEGTILRAPRIRASKPATLDPLADGLAYRSVPYGLLRRAGLHAIGFRYAEGITTGEDIEATLRLWFRSGTICYPYGAPAYRQTDDSGTGRVTSTVLPLNEEFQWLERLFSSEWLAAASTPERRSIALKILRVHGIGALRRRAAAAPARESPQLMWNETERRAWSGLLSGLYGMAGGALPALNRRDAALAKAATNASSVQELRTAVGLHERAGRAGELLTVNPMHVLAEESVLRHFLNEKMRTKYGVYAAPTPAQGAGFTANDG